MQENIDPAYYPPRGVMVAHIITAPRGSWVAERCVRSRPDTGTILLLDHNHALDLLCRTLSLHGSLDGADIAALRTLPLERRTYRAGAYLVREAEVPKSNMILLSGYAYRQKISSDGGRQIVSLHIPGDVLDFQNLYLAEADHDIQTLTSADVGLVPRNAMQDLLAARPAIAKAVITSILVEASILREWILNVGRRPAKERLAHMLCELAVRLDAQGLADKQGYYIPMTQAQIGDALGLTSVHVNRSIKALEAQELIKRDGRRIAFPRWREMLILADFNDRYLHLPASTMSPAL